MYIPSDFLVKKPKIEVLERSCQVVHDFSIYIERENSSVLQPRTPNLTEIEDVELPLNFLDPLSPERDTTLQRPCLQSPFKQFNGGLYPRSDSSFIQSRRGARKDFLCRQFWKAGDYEGNFLEQVSPAGGMDHARVHPKFLHSNATSHKWALGAIAELLDNSLDEVVNGATFVNVDMFRNPRDASPMLVIEDDGGGMSPDNLRHCMSLGFSVKSKSANTIGQYGNGFKTSTMRLGADVIVFSCSPTSDACYATKSIGMLSYTFLRETGQEDIIVPMVDYELQVPGLQKLVRTSLEDWDRNMNILKQWSPYATESDLLHQFREMKTQGTRIVIYNLWEDELGQLELDFETDSYDIQLRGTNRDEKKIFLAKQHSNSRHYFTYRYSLRSYASILYLRLPKDFKIILRGEEVDHHSLVKDLMLTQKITYKPQLGPDNEQKESTKLLAPVTIGFVKDAKKHIDIQGFNVYHKNRLIKPFWRIWNASSSQGRGIIGVLEANFVEPAHDKQGFERTTVLARLEARLMRMQKIYWFKHCHKVGYSNSRLRKKVNFSQEQSMSSDGSDCEYWKRKKGCRALSRMRSKQETWPFPYSLPVTKALRSKRRPRVYQSAAILRKPEFEEATLTKSGLAIEKVSVYPATGGMHGPFASPASILTSAHMDESPVIGEMDVAKYAEISEIERGPSRHESSTLNKLKIIQDKRLLIEVERRRKLEAHLFFLEQQAEAVRKRIESVTKERDNVRDILEEEQRQGVAEDEELRKMLKEVLIRVRHLEADNRRLTLAIY